MRSTEQCCYRGEPLALREGVAFIHAFITEPAFDAVSPVDMHQRHRES